jgi:hypothetical protein
MTIPQFTAGQVLTAAELNAMVDAINAGGGMTEVTAFTASGTFTVPTGVTYAVAHILAGGGSTGDSGTAAGGNSSVAFASGTITATGGNGQGSNQLLNAQQSVGQANSGNGGQSYGNDNTNPGAHWIRAQNGAYIVAGATVTPAASITVTVGAGATAGNNGAAGGSGYVWIEYQV